MNNDSLNNQIKSLFLQRLTNKYQYMKQIKTISTIILLVVLTGCGDKQSANDLIIVDVSKSYPEKELMLQDFMDVEYIKLETTDEFLTQGVVMAAGTEIILVKNRINDGELFVFERKTGKGLRKINRRGQGSEEYLSISEIVLDEENNEMYVIDNGRKKILVYDLFGNFKRSFKVTDADMHINTYNYNRDNLICYIPYIDLENHSNIIHSSHLVISKQDGSITRNISIPLNKIKSTVLRMGEDYAVPSPATLYQVIPNHGNWVLMDTSSDTLYNYVPDDDIKIPMIVRTPSIHAMDPPVVFLTPSILTDNYYFFRTLKLSVDSAGRFPIFELMYDKQENAIFTPKVYNDDFSYKRSVNMTSKPVNHEVAAGLILEAFRLVEDYEKGQLKGRLKEIAATLNNESNPVIMLVKYRK